MDESVRPPVVLVVDDDHDVLELMQASLPRAGFQVRVADSAARAEELVQSERIDVVVTDLSLGDDGGLALCEKWHDERPDLPVLVLTGHGEAKEAALSLGACGVLVKPVETDELLAALRAALKLPSDS